MMYLHPSSCRRETLKTRCQPVGFDADAIAEPLMEVGAKAEGEPMEEPMEEPQPSEGPLEEPEMAAAALPGGGEMFIGAGREAKARKKPPPRSAPNLAVVEEFVGQLREFRALQQELAPWTEAFRLEHGRKPRVDDVELTRPSPTPDFCACNERLNAL